MKQNRLPIACALLCLALLMLCGGLPFGAGGRARGGQLEVRVASVGAVLAGPGEVAREVVAVAGPPPGQGWAALESDGFTARTRGLAAVLDAGQPLGLALEGAPRRTFLMRPRRLLADHFQVTLGGDQSLRLEAGTRVYEGREHRGGQSVRLVVALAGGAVAAVLTEANGNVIRLRTDAATGDLRALTRRAEQEQISCAIDPHTGWAAARAGAAPVEEADWQEAAAAALDPLALPSNGFDPETGRLDKFVEPVPHGQAYELSLKDLLAIVTLDKSVTGANTTERLTQITSEYLAKTADLASIQESNLGIRHLIQELILTPDAAAFPDVPNSLGDYGAWISARRPRGTFRWDLSTKFGNGAFSGGVIGLAWVRTLGSTAPVNVCAKGFGVALEAHEQGHNLGSDHSSGGIMNASLVDSRDFFADVSAGETSAMQIYSHAATRLTGSNVMRHAEEIPWAVDDAADTVPGQAIELLPLLNDRSGVRNGIANTVLTIEEVGRVYPIQAGSARVTGPDRVRFEPTPGYEGPAWFSYSLRGNQGNGGQGWLHRADIAVEVGAWNEDSLALRLAPGQAFSFRPTSSADSTIVSQPRQARVDTGRNDRHLVIIRVQADAAGADSFQMLRNGVPVTVSLTYVADYLQTRPDYFSLMPGQASLRLAPMVNDQVAGYRNHASVRPIVGLGQAAAGASYFPGAARLISAKLLNPAKGALALSARAFTIDNVSTDVYNGQMTFTPAAGARGVAAIEYVVEDAAGVRQANSAYIILPFGEISSPAADRVLIEAGHGLVLETAPQTAADPPLSGQVSVQWSLLRGPEGGAVEFSEAAAKRTRASFSRPGEYVLRLTLSDNGFASSDDVAVAVEAPSSGEGEPPAAWWKLDETAGTIALDASGGNRSGIYAGGVASTAGVLGAARNFDGADDWVNLSAQVAAVQGLAEGTLSAWFKTNSSSLRTLFSASNRTRPDRSLRLYVEGGILKYKVLGDAGTEVASLASPSAVNNDVWHHVAVTVDGARQAKLYLDGAAVREGVRPFFGGILNLDTLAIGRHLTSTGSDYWRGQVDDVRIYSRPLTAEEVGILARLSENRAPRIAFGVRSLTVGGRSAPTALLAATVRDDARPALPGMTTTTWSAEGPGAAAFGNPAELATALSVGALGRYRLRLEADDGAVRTWREIEATFAGNAPGAPYALGLPDLAVSPRAAPSRVDLGAAFGDLDGAAADLAFAVTGNSNPAIFAAVAIAGGAPPGLLLSFSANSGISDLTVRATDPGGAFVETTFRVAVANQAPVVAAQAMAVGENAAAGTLVGQVAASDPEGAALRFELVGGNAFETFAIDTATGQLRVASSFGLDFEMRPVFDLVVRVSEVGNPLLASRAQVQVKLGDTNEAPAFGGQHFVLRAGVAGSGDVGTLAASDPEGQAVSFAIVGGNAGGVFSIAAGGLLRAANPAGLDIAATPRFTLTIAASDGAVPPAVTESAVRVTLEASLVSAGAALRWLVPTASLGTTWLARSFSDVGWAAGTSGIGYDTGTGYDALLATDVQAAMFNVATSLYVRLPFTVANPAALGTLRLRVKYEDGYQAWINGSAAAGHDGPTTLAFNSAATSARNEDEAVAFRDDDITPLANSLVAGSNVLAIQVLNESAASSDLLLVPELIWSPGGSAAVPNPPQLAAGAAGSLTQTSAALAASLLGTGGAAPRVTWYWGRQDGGRNPAAWEHAHELAAVSAVGPLSFPLANLRPGTRYFYGLRGSNGGGEAWSGSASFSTLEAPGIALLTSADPMRFLAPTSDEWGGRWKQLDFDDRSWTPFVHGLGYDRGTGYQAHFAAGRDVAGAMYNLASSVYVRAPFFADQLSQIAGLRLSVKYDDGFVAYLNGHEVARRGAPALAGDLPWNSTASASRDEVAAVAFEVIDLSGQRSRLVEGLNVLSFQGLNQTADSSDFLLVPLLEGQPAGTVQRPEIEVVQASAVSASGAVLEGLLGSTGGEAPQVSVCWGPLDGGSDFAAWPQSLLVRAPGPGPLAVPIHGLRPLTPYFFRFFARNSAGSDPGGRSGTFVTSGGGGLNFGSWIESYPAVPSGARGAEADADGDGLSNFAEYAAGGDPARGDDAAGRQPVLRAIPGSQPPAVELRWRRRLDFAARGLAYSVESALDPAATWTPRPSAPIGLNPAGDGATEWVAERLEVPLGTKAWLLRVRVRQE